MNDEDWNNCGKGRWQYIHKGLSTWFLDEAQIICTRRDQWQLFINRQYIGAFTSWEEARDATPMMISIHGYKESRA